MNRSSLAVLSLFSFLLLFTSISVAQLGEVAGQPHFNVSIGARETLPVILVDQASYPLPVRVMLPTLTSKDANAISPILSASPMEGNIPADGELQINVTAYMPGGTNKPGYTWTGVMQIITVPTNASAPSAGGASILEGVAKIITVTATQHVSSLWDYLVPAVVVVVVIAAAGAAFLFYRGRPRKASAAKRRKRR